LKRKAPPQSIDNLAEHRPLIGASLRESVRVLSARAQKLPQHGESVLSESGRAA
jgi:hypothetical protein